MRALSELNDTTNKDGTMEKSADGITKTILVNTSASTSQPRNTQALSRARRHNLMRLKMKRSMANATTLPSLGVEDSLPSLGAEDYHQDQQDVDDEQDEDEDEKGKENYVAIDKGDLNSNEETLMAQLRQVQSEVRQNELLLQRQQQQEVKFTEEKDSFTFLTGINETIDADEPVEPDISEEANVDVKATIEDKERDGNDVDDDLAWLNCRKLFKVVHPTGARVRRTPDIQSSGLSVLQPGTIFESDEERVNGAGILVVRLATGGWVHTMYSASNGRIIQEVSLDGKPKGDIDDVTTKAKSKKANNEPKVIRENRKEKLLEEAKKAVLWKREKKDTAFYEMDMQSRQEVWMNRKAAKAERLERDKMVEMKQQMPRVPDLSKTKDSWMRAKKMHEEQLMKAHFDIEMKHQKEMEIQQKRRMKLSERVHELRRLSKLNEGILVGEDSVMSSYDVDGLIEEGSIGKMIKAIKRPKKKKVRRVTNESDRQIEYSSSALELLSENIQCSENKAAMQELEQDSVVMRQSRTTSAPTSRAPISAQATFKTLKRGVSAKMTVGSKQSRQPRPMNVTEGNVGNADDDMSVWLREELQKRSRSVLKEEPREGGNKDDQGACFKREGAA